MTDQDPARVRVLIVSAATSVWGAQLYLLDQVAPLRHRGVDLTLATPADSEFAREWDRRGFPLLDVPLRSRTGLTRPGSPDRASRLSLGQDLVAMARGSQLLLSAGRGFDVLHSYGLRTHLEVAVAGKLLRRPVALDLVNIVRPGVGRKVLNLAGRLATLTVANSRATLATLGPSVPAVVIHPGIDLGRFRPEPPEPELRSQLGGDDAVPLVAIIGRIDVRKGVQILVEALAQATGPASRARLIVVGEAGTGPVEFARDLQSRATELLGERVSFIGRRDDVPAIIRAVDVVVNASMAEPFGLTMLEAQACRTPVIGTDAGGIPEFVEHGITGLLVPPFNVEPLAAALDRLLGDRELQEQLVGEAYRRAVPARGLEAQYDELAQLYRDLARRPAAVSV